MSTADQSLPPIGSGYGGGSQMGVPSPGHAEREAKERRELIEEFLTSNPQWVPSTSGHEVAAYRLDKQRMFIVFERRMGEEIHPSWFDPKNKLNKVFDEEVNAVLALLVHRKASGMWPYSLFQV